MRELVNLGQLSSCGEGETGIGMGALTHVSQLEEAGVKVLLDANDSDVMESHGVFARSGISTCCASIRHVMYAHTFSCDMHDSPWASATQSSSAASSASSGVMSGMSTVAIFPCTWQTAYAPIARHCASWSCTWDTGPRRDGSRHEREATAGVSSHSAGHHLQIFVSLDQIFVSYASPRLSCCQ